MRLVKQFNIQRKGLLAILLLCLFIGSLPMSYEIQMIYAVFTAALFCVLAVISTGQRHNPVIIAFAMLVLGNGLIAVSRDILRPYEALSIFGLFFLHFLWKKEPQMARLLSQRLAAVLIFINYVWFFVQFSSEGFDLFSEKNFSGVFFERGFMAVLLFLAVLHLKMTSRVAVLPLLIVSGSVFAILAAVILIFLILMELKFVPALIAIVIGSLGSIFIVANSSLSFEKPIEFVANLSIVKRVTEGERHNINTRSLERREYEPIRDFYYNPKVDKTLWGLGDRDVASGVPHNKLAELGLVSFAIFKLWEFLLLLNLTSKSGSFKKISAFALWLMLSGYIFAVYIPSLFLLLAGLFQRTKSNSADNAYPVNQRIAVDHGQ